MSMVDFLIRSPRHAIWIKLYLNLIQWGGWTTLVMVLPSAFESWVGSVGDVSAWMDGRVLLGGNLGYHWSLLVFGWSPLTLARKVCQNLDQAGRVRKHIEPIDRILLTCRLYCWRGGGLMVTGRQERYGIRWSSFSLARMFLSNLRELGRVMGQIEHAIGRYIVFGYLYVGRGNYIYPWSKPNKPIKKKP